MDRLKRQLLNLAIGELAALCAFIYIYSSLNLGEASLVAFSYLVLILLQGSMHWSYRYILIIKKGKTSPRIIEFLRLLRWLNIGILMMISILIPIIKGNFKDLIASIGLLIFGIIEYINYYWYRLSYGKSGFNIRILLNTRLQKSSIGKLIKK